MSETLAARRPGGLPLVLRYTAFALLAGATNLAVQAAAMALYQGPYALVLAMVAGTIAGLVPKFLLDKYWIFYDRAPGVARGFRQLILYGLLSVVTTLLFWVFEVVFHWLGDGGPLRYVGAALGLGLGYWLKYQMDKRWVFGG